MNLNKFQSEEKMKLSDEVIAHIAQILQIAIITGTDVVDNMRLVTLEEREGTMFLNEEYKENAAKNLEKMLNESEVLQQDAGQ